MLTDPSGACDTFAMRYNAGKSSPSFLIAVTVLVLSVVGYAAWSYLRPGPYAVSEQIVRDFVGTLSGEVRDFRRDLRALGKKGESDPSKVDAVVAEIDQLVLKAKTEIDDQMELAVDELLDLDIRVRTQRNRRDRLDKRAGEAAELVVDLAEETKEKLRGG